MMRQSKSADDLLEIAGRLRMFALEAHDLCYLDKFRRGAENLEIEAVGYAISSAVAAALRRERWTKRNLH